MIPNAYIGKYHITLGLAVTRRITSPSVGEWNIVMSLSVCPHAYVRNLTMSKLHQILCPRYQWPWLDLSLAAFR